MPATTGSWKPTWSPGHTSPGLPPLVVVQDPHDDYAFMAAHTPALGRITVHPTPVASAPAALAHDLLRSMGKHLPVAGSEDGTYWTGNAQTAWRVVATWMLALRIHHVIITRTHRISSRHFEHLFVLREFTKIRLTLLCHGPLPPALAAILAALPHAAVHSLTAARRAVGAPGPPSSADRFAWWEAGEQSLPHPGEPCFMLPTRRATSRAVIEAAARRLGHTVLPLPAVGRFPPEPDEPTALLAHRLHARVAHPVHAAALAVRVFAAQTAPPGPNEPWPGDADTVLGSGLARGSPPLRAAGGARGQCFPAPPQVLGPRGCDRSSPRLQPARAPGTRHEAALGPHLAFQAASSRQQRGRHTSTEPGSIMSPAGTQPARIQKE
ncbi:hypothetical protein [Streptomyces koyangensis]